MSKPRSACTGRLSARSGLSLFPNPFPPQGSEPCGWRGAIDWQKVRQINRWLGCPFLPLVFLLIRTPSL